MTKKNTSTGALASKKVRQLPHDLDAERAVLGSVLCNPKALDAVTLKPEAFFKPAHRMIYEAMLRLRTQSVEIDPVTLSSFLRETGQLEVAGGLPHLIVLTEAVPTSANVNHYARTVAECELRRKLIEVGRDIATLAEESPDAETAADAAQQAVFEATRRSTDRGPAPASNLMVRVFQQIETTSALGSGITGIGSPFEKLDELTSGWQDKDLIILAGRPSMGKTAFGLSLAWFAAFHLGRKVLICSLEMSEEQLGLRLLAQQARIDLQRLRRGLLLEEHWPKLGRATGQVADAPLWIDDSEAITVAHLGRVCRRLAAENGLDLVVLDYLQLMQGIGTSREQEISSISRGLKATAKSLGVPVIALSQLNRKVEERVDKRPGLADLRESGAIEQDADVILFVYRDEVYNKETEDRGIAEIIVAKQRNGPIGTVRTRFEHRFTGFAPLQEDHTMPIPQVLDSAGRKIPKSRKRSWETI